VKRRVPARYGTGVLERQPTHSGRVDDGACVILLTTPGAKVPRLFAADESSLFPDDRGKKFDGSVVFDRYLPPL
jgi:hypothetical protein